MRPGAPNAESPGSLVAILTAFLLSWLVVGWACANKIGSSPAPATNLPRQVEDVAAAPAKPRLPPGCLKFEPVRLVQCFVGGTKLLEGPTLIMCQQTEPDRWVLVSEKGEAVTI